MRQFHPNAALCAALGAVFWGFSGTASQYLFMHYEISPLCLTSYRMTLSGVLLAAICLLTKRESFLAMPRNRRAVWQEIVFAIAGLMCVQLTYLTTISHSNSATATVLQNLSVAMLAAYTALRSRKPLSTLQLISVGLALLGVFLLATHGNLRTMVMSREALFWGLGSAVGVCTYSLLTAVMVPKWPSQVVTAYGMLIGGLAIGIGSGSLFTLPPLDAKGLFVLALIVLIGTVGAFTLFIQSISEIGAMKATLIGCLEPVSATIISAVWLGSRFALIDIAGFACILAMVVLLSFERKPQG